jgi:hypothetical protein
MYDDEIPEIMHGKYGGERVACSESDKEMTSSLAREWFSDGQTSMLEMTERNRSIQAHL